MSDGWGISIATFVHVTLSYIPMLSPGSAPTRSQEAAPDVGRIEEKGKLVIAPR